MLEYSNDLYAKIEWLPANFSGLQFICGNQFHPSIGLDTLIAIRIRERFVVRAFPSAPNLCIWIADCVFLLHINRCKSIKR